MLGAPPKQMRPIFTVVDIRELGVTTRIGFKFYTGNHLKQSLDITDRKFFGGFVQVSET